MGVRRRRWRWDAEVLIINGAPRRVDLTRAHRHRSAFLHTSAQGFLVLLREPRTALASILRNGDNSADLCSGAKDAGMSTLQVPLDDRQKAFIDAQVAEGNHGTAADYVLSLVREASRRKGWAQIEQQVLAGLETPLEQMTQD